MYMCVLERCIVSVNVMLYLTKHFDKIMFFFITLNLFGVTEENYYLFFHRLKCLSSKRE